MLRYSYSILTPKFVFLERQLDIKIWQCWDVWTDSNVTCTKHVSIDPLRQVGTCAKNLRSFPNNFQSNNVFRRGEQKAWLVLVWFTSIFVRQDSWQIPVQMSKYLFLLSQLDRQSVFISSMRVIFLRKARATYSWSVNSTVVKLWRPLMKVDRLRCK